MRKPILLAALAGLQILASRPVMALEAGVSRIDISPRQVTGVSMCGYATRDENPSQGLHDSLYARVLVLDDGRTRVALASVDLIGLNVSRDPAPGRLPRLLRAAGFDAWVIASTHTHGGPRVLDLGEPYLADRTWPPEDPYTSWVEDQITAAAVEAGGYLRPVRAAAGSGQVDISFNRRLVRPDGSVEMIWGRAGQFQAADLGPTDPEVGVVRLEDDGGKVVAVLANYACHPVVLGGGNRWMTADFPGYAMALVERELPGSMCLFLQGAAGDLDPRIDVQNRFEPARDQGEALGREIVRVATDLDDAGDLGEELALAWTPWTHTYGRYYDRQRLVTASFGMLQVGSRLAMLCLPGEPFVGLQLDLKARSPVPHTYLVGYANGYAGYLPTMAAHREGGYGANQGGTLHLEPRAGEDMVAQAVQELGRQVWVRPLPDTITTGLAVTLEAAVQPILAPDTEAVVLADLSQLGGSSRHRLAEVGGGVHELTVDLGPGLMPGQRQLTLYLETADGSQRPYLASTVMVLPDCRLAVWEKGLAPGWRAEGSGADLESVSFAGRSAAACHAQPPSTGSIRDIWTLDLRSDRLLQIGGYEDLRFEFHPGSTAALTDPWVSLYINETRVDLSDRVDFGLEAWQEVVIPLAELDLADAHLTRLRLWGAMSGTFYLDNVVFGLAPSPSTAVAQQPRAAVPDGLCLGPAYPNPFNAQVAIPFYLPTRQAALVSIHSAAGQKVATLVSATLSPGRHSVLWDGRDDAGRDAASGVYLVRLTVSGHTITRRLALVR